MSERLPAGDTLNEAFQFGLKRWTTVFRYGWATVVLSGLLIAAFVLLAVDTAVFNDQYAMESVEEIGDVLNFSLGATVLIAGLIYLLISLLFCGVVASVYRLAALGEDRPGIVQLRLDGPAVRVFLSYVIITALSGLIWLAASIVSMAVGGLGPGGLLKECIAFFQSIMSAEAGGGSEMEVFNAMASMLQAFFLPGMIALIPLLYVNVKLIPFPPGSAAENRLLLFGSFSMTFGHAWSIFGIYVLYVIFLIVLTLIFEMAAAIMQAIATIMTTMGGAAALGGVIFIGILFAASIFFNVYIFAVQTALRAIVYRRLTGGA